MCKIILNRLTLAVGIFLCTVMMFSCKKSVEQAITSSNGMNVTFNIAGVKDLNKGSNSKLASKNKNVSPRIGDGQAKENSSIKVNKSLPNVSLDIVDEVTDIGFSFDALKNQELNKTASTSPMVSGRKFRVVILDDATNAIVKTVQANVDRGVNLDLEVGKSYKWYAYSYNDTEDITAPTAAQTIETPTDKDLLYAKSSAPFTVGEGEVAIDILFEHQVAMLSIELDYDRLFASIPPNEAGSTSFSNNLNWSFTTAPNFLYKGTFSLTTGVVSNHVLYSADINERIKNHSTEENTKVAECYFVPPPSGTSVSDNFTISLNTLNVKFFNEAANVAVISTSNPLTHTFSSLSSNTGEKYVAEFKFWYTFNKLNILHVTRSNNYSYAAQPKDLREGQGMTATLPNPSPSAHHTSYNMIKEAKNFGNLSNSIVRTNGFGHRILSHNFRIDTALHLGANPTIAPPDIVIIGTYYEMDANDAQALLEYVNRGGVLFLMSDGVDNSDYQSHRQFFKLLFNTATTSNKSGFDGGSVYKLSDINDEILNGPFGDVRNMHWGEDATATIALQNYPDADVTSYSGSVPVNKSNAASIGATMVKHNSKHFFWVGDGGFIACDEVSGAHGSPSNPATGSWASYANQPFATATAPDKVTRRHPYPYLSTHYEFFPVPRKYGYSGNGFDRYYHNVYNSTVFANFMSWAVANATFFGINTGGLQGDYHEF